MYQIMGHMKVRKQRVVLETDEGTCYSEEMLKEVWETRLRQLGATYYKVIEVKISEDNLPRHWV